MENEKWDFFVSFTSTDEQNARWIAAELEAAGYRVLFQHHQFVPGADFAGLMNQGATCARRTLAWVPQLLGCESARMWVLSWGNGCRPGDGSCH